MFSPDGKLLAVGGDETVTLWEMGLDTWTRMARQMANRNLTPDERQRYLEP